MKNTNNIDYLIKILNKKLLNKLVKILFTLLVPIIFFIYFFYKQKLIAFSIFFLTFLFFGISKIFNSIFNYFKYRKIIEYGKVEQINIQKKTLLNNKKLYTIEYFFYLDNGLKIVDTDTIEINVLNSNKIDIIHNNQSNNINFSIYTRGDKWEI